MRSDVRNAGPLSRLGAKLVPAEQPLADAKSAVEQLQFTDADLALASARTQLHTAQLVGTGIVGGSALLLVVLVLAVALSWRRHTRRARPSPVAVPATPAPTPLGGGVGASDA